MKFEEIHEELLRSSETGVIHQLTKSFFEKYDCFFGIDGSLAEHWVHSEYLRGVNEDTGRTNCRYNEIQKAVNQYCESFINLYYSGKVRHKYTPFAFLCEFETSDYYDSDNEFKASGIIYRAVKNLVYVDKAIGSVLSVYGHSKNQNAQAG